MGKKDVITNDFFNENPRFADIVNVGVFHGKKILKAENLENTKGLNISMIDESLEASEQTVVYKFRDLVKKSVSGVNFVLLGIENQWNIHYAMPVRIMGYDFLTYDDQLKKIRKIHKRKRDLSGAEYVSGFSKKDKLHPVVTILLYYGEAPWDGPRSLFEMIDWKGIPEEVREIAADYPLHIIDVRRFEDTESLETDVRIVFGFLQRQKDSEKLTAYMQENKEAFSNLEDDTYDMISALSNSKELLSIKNKSKGKEMLCDMCEALQQLKKEYGIETLVLDNLEDGNSMERIVEKLEKRFQLSKEEAQQYFDKYCKK